jgi:beta-glucosidase
MHLFVLAVGALAGTDAADCAAARGVVDPTAWPIGSRDTLIRPAVEAFVDQLLATLTLEEKVGQMVQADIGSISPADLYQYKLGSILAGGNAAPGGNVRATPAEWLALAESFAGATTAAAAAAGRRPIPLLFGIDAVHGHARIPGATIFPHNIGLGAAHDPELVNRVGRATAAEVSVTGIDWTFSPTIAVVRDPRWGRSYESYSEDPRLVADYAAAMVAGLQGSLGTPDFMASGHTMASAKHFLGDGGTIDGRDQFDNQSSVDELVRIHAAGYPPAIAAGTLTIMASYNSWQGTKMHANGALLTEVLKDRLGFNGFVVGDWNAQEEIPGCTKYDCPAVILAGLDMVMAPDSWKEFYRNTLAHARSGEIPGARIDDAVRRILRVKALAGVFDRPAPKNRPAAGQFDQLGSAAHRALAREAVRRSLVLLKNNGNVLPLSAHGNFLVTGDAADSVGVQSGGWTIDWQGNHNTNADFPGATSIFAGIRAAVVAGGGTASLSRDGYVADKPDAAIVVFGEGPYAEFQGDRETLEFSPGDKHSLMLMRRLHAGGIPVIAVFVSGRPMWVNPELNAADAFVAAWLPGSEGEGVADVLFRTPEGKVRYDFTGKLGFSWPASAMPVTFDSQGKPRGTLFARGYGLNYSHPVMTGIVGEAPNATPDRHGADVLFAGGRVTAPWSFYVADATAEVRVTTPQQLSPTGALVFTLDSSGGAAVWSGGGAAVLRIGGRPIDLRGRADSDDSVVLRFRLDKLPTAAVRMGVRCAAPYGAAVTPGDKFASIPEQQWVNCGAAAEPMLDVTREVAAAPVGSWETLAFPLSCFANAGADLSAVEAPFAIATYGSFAVTISDIRYVRTKRPGRCPRAR